MQIRRSKVVFASVVMVLLVSLVLAACGGETTTTVTSTVTQTQVTTQTAAGATVTTTVGAGQTVTLTPAPVTSTATTTVTAPGTSTTVTQTKTVTSGGGGVPTDIPEMTLKFSSYIASTPAISRGHQWVMDQVTARTGGKVKFQTFWNAALFKGEDTLQAVKSGAVDLGVVVANYSVADNPHWATQDSPNNVNDNWAAVWASYDNMHTNPWLVQEFAKNNVVPTMGYASGSMRYSFTKQVNSAADAKGLRVKSTGGARSKLLEVMGFVPVQVTITEQYDAFDKGVIDGGTATTPYNWSLAFYEVAPYSYTATGWGITTAVAMCINKTKWDSWPQSLRDIFDQVIREANDVLARTVMEEENSLRPQIEAKGGKFLDFPADVQALALEGAKQGLEGWMTTYEAKGIVVRQSYDYFQKLVSIYESQAKQLGYPWERGATVPTI